LSKFVFFLIVMKIVSVAPNITEILLDMGITPDATTVHTNVGNETVGKWLSPDLEEINDIKPDIVFTSDSLQDKINKELRSMGHNVNHYDTWKS
jgi:ABC-type Fe3+-hydroxamate transport system substrate-binding protein